MTQSQATSEESLQNAYGLVGAVANILEKLHAEGFIASKVYPNLGLSKVKAVLLEKPELGGVVALEAFVRKIADLFESKQLLHPSATEKFQALFSEYLAAALGACDLVTGSGSTSRNSSTLH